MNPPEFTGGSDAVKITLGPKGRNVVLDKAFGAPTITKDGVSAAKEIELENKFENMGAQMVKEVASKTSGVAGDGTTAVRGSPMALLICLYYIGETVEKALHTHPRLTRLHTGLLRIVSFLSPGRS